MTPTPQKAPGTGGGSIAIRGFLVQTLVALLDITNADPLFTEITLEPAIGDEQFDFLWKDKNGSHAVQVKSTANIFEKSAVEKWVARLEAARLTEDCQLVLVGLIHPDLEKISEIGKVKLQKKNLDLQGLFDQAAHRVAKFIHAQKLDGGTPDDHELVAKALVTQLEHYSTKSETLGQEDFINLLRKWIGDAPRQENRFAPSRFFRGSNQGSDLLIGRDEELARLDSAWADTEKKNVVAIVAWGGIGKTSLIAHWAARKLAQSGHGGIERYFDWSFYKQGTRREGDAAGVTYATSADLFLKEGLEFFGDSVLANSNVGAWQKGERLAQLVSQHVTLLVLDGIEPLQEAKTGELRDDGLRALLRGLAAQNRGLCLVTTRQSVPDLNTWHNTTAPEWELAHLSNEAGAALLTKLGVKGTKNEKCELSSQIKGHALTLTLLGRYLARVHYGDIRRVDRIDFTEVNEKEQGGHAFRVIAAYEQWFEESKCFAELAILRMLGLFDRTATPDCLFALCDPPITGLTDTVAPLNEDNWNEAVSNLAELNLVEQQPWTIGNLVGYSEKSANAVWRAAVEQDTFLKLGAPESFKVSDLPHSIRHALDTHSLVRNFFSKRLRESAAEKWKEAHSRLFHHLQTSAPYWPEGLESLQPLYQAIAHGCEAGLYHEAGTDVYIARILRGRSGAYVFYSIKWLGAINADLAAIGCFFNQKWTRPNTLLDRDQQAWAFAHASYLLSASGRLEEALVPSIQAFKMTPAHDFLNLTLAAGNLSELNLKLGKIENALVYGEKSAKLATLSGNSFQRLSKLSFVAQAAHQINRVKEAKRKFELAESILATRQPDKPFLYSVSGFAFCNLLLAKAEIECWKYILGINTEKVSDSIIRQCCIVEDRATQINNWAHKAANAGHLSIALVNLTLALIHLYKKILTKHAANSSPICNPGIPDESTEILYLDISIKEFNHAGLLDYLPNGLLARSWQRFFINKCNGSESTQTDLDEAWEITERGPMRLHMADIHLYRARLFFREAKYPWESPAADLAAAEKLINECGYHRRDEELADAKKAILGK